MKVTRSAIVVTVASAAVALLAPAAATASTAVPAGYEIDSSTLAPGVEHLVLRRSEGERETVNAAVVSAGAAAAMRVATGGGSGELGALVETSAMCRRVGCLVAVNGPMKERSTHHPIGALVRNGEMLRSPWKPEKTAVRQFMIAPDGGASVGALEWRGALVAGGEELALTGVNVPREGDALVLYTPHFGGSTRTDASGFEIVFRAAAPPALGRKVSVELIEGRDAYGDTGIPAGGGVLSGRGRSAEALRALWARIAAGAVPAAAELGLDSERPVAESIGGRPVLVRDGRRVALTERDVARIDGRHPRTIAGRTRAGDLLLVTVDGRQDGYSEGITLDEAADLMLALGASEAINLDGGGSTTFATRDGPLNRPSDRLVRRGRNEKVVSSAGPHDRVVASVERQVAAALVVVPAAPAAAPSSVPAASRPAARTGSHTVPAAPASVPAAEAPRIALLRAARDHGGPPDRRTGPLAAAALLAVLVPAAWMRLGWRRLRQAK